MATYELWQHFSYGKPEQNGGHQGQSFAHGHNYMGHNYTGHNHTGQNYTDHNCIGHKYIAASTSRRPSRSASACVPACPGRAAVLPTCRRAITNRAITNTLANMLTNMRSCRPAAWPPGRLAVWHLAWSAGRHGVWHRVGSDPSLDWLRLASRPV